MRVLLLNTPHEKERFVKVERCMQPAGAWASLWPPLPLMYGQAILDEQGAETKLIDAEAENLSVEKTCSKIENFDPEVLVMNISPQTLSSDLKILSYVKENLPKCITVAIGAITSLCPDAFAKFTGFDYAVVSDVELPLVEIYKKGKKEKRTKFLKKEIKNLNELPFPALYDLNLDKYLMPFTRERWTLVNPARGCKYRCSFCIVPLIYGSRVRYRSPENFVDEIERDWEEYEIRNFLFWTETFTQNLQWAKSICKEIIKRNLEIKWMATTRVDCVNREILKLMKKAGCFMISYGVESLNQDVLNKCGKGTAVKKIEKAIKLTKKAGLEIMAHIIIGLPGMRKKDIVDTVRWLIGNDITYAQFYCSTPYPGTKLAELARKKNWTQTFSFDLNKASMGNEYMERHEIERFRKWAYRKFYLRPSFLLREVKKYSLVNLARSGLTFFKDWVLS